MVILAGATLPSIKINLKGSEVDLFEHFQNNTGVLFGVPGAFSPVCTQTHLPGFRDRAKQFKSKVNFLGCIAVNDPYVLKAWAKHTHIRDHLTFVADLDGTLSKALGVYHQYVDVNLGWRCRRFAMVIEKGAKVFWIGLDDDAFAENVMTKVDEMLAARASDMIPSWNYSEGGEDWSVENGLSSALVRQSPIDLETISAEPSDEPPIQLHFSVTPGAMTISDPKSSGCPVLELRPKSLTPLASMTYNSARYLLNRIAVKMPAEHLIDGIRKDAELQLDFTAPGMARAILAVLVSAGEDPDPFFGAMIESLKNRDEDDVAKPLASVGGLGELMCKLIPCCLYDENEGGQSGDKSTLWAYEGSATTPPCDGPVTWLVAARGATATQSEIDELREALGIADAGWARKIQKNDSVIKVLQLSVEV